MTELPAPAPTAVAMPPRAGRPPDGGTGGRRFGGLRGIRARILASYLGLLLLSGVLSTLAIHEVLVFSLGSRVDAALGQEVRELNRLLINGRDTRTGERFTSAERAFDTFVARNVPSDDEAFLAFVDGRLHVSVLSRFPPTGVPAEVLDRFAAASRQSGSGGPVDGEFETGLGTAHYRSLGARIGDDNALFVVTVLPVEEREEIADLQLFGAAGVTAVLLLAAAAAWFAVNRTLVPVRQLTSTARQISQSDLGRRIEVRGTDESAEMARTFNAMLDRLEVIFRTERDFVRDASHELRIPLTVCLGNLELIREGVLQDDAERDETIALTLDEVERMSRIVEDLRMLADAQHADFLQPEPIDVAAFTAELAGKARALAPRRWEVDAAGSGTLLADRHRLTEAVMNLADNAVHHTAPDDVVAFGTAVRAADVQIWVRDTGRGVPVAEQGRIFDRFRRGSFATRHYRGSGLGLAIVRAVAEAHGGTVELRSAPDTGARFTVTIPLRPSRGLNRTPSWG